MHVKETNAFEKAFDHTLTHYPLSKNSIWEYIKKTLPANPKMGILFPGFQGLEVRKVRIPLKEYKIGKSGGLRVIYLVINNLFIPLNIYSKGEKCSEGQRLQQTRSLLKSILQELENCN